jgi:hypothetical protein
VERTDRTFGSSILDREAFFSSPLFREHPNIINHWTYVEDFPEMKAALM